MYVQVAGLPYMMKTLYGFNTEQVGLIYLTTWYVLLPRSRAPPADSSIGAVFGYAGGHIQEYLYRRYAPKRGVEARLYTPMVAGVLFAVGCFITGFTARPNIPWIGSAIGQVVVISESHPITRLTTAGVMIIYVTAFT